MTTDLGASALVFAADLEARGDVAGVASLFETAAASVGMTASACGMVSGPKALSAEPFHFVNWPADWLQLYKERGFLRMDAVPRWAMVSGAPVAWSELVPSLPANDPGRVVYAEAVRWGFREGYVTPVRSQEGDLGLVSVAGPRHALAPAEKLYLQAISAAALHRAQALSRAGPAVGNDAFTLREREAIALLSQGFTDREIGKVLGISALTVHTHVAHARAKVGARSRAHLVAIAGGAGMA